TNDDRDPDRPPEEPKVTRRILFRAGQLQHDVPAPVLDAASTGTLDQRPVASGHQSNRCWIEAGLDVMPIGSVTLSDGHGPGERARTRRSARASTRCRSRCGSSRSGYFVAFLA